MERPATGDGERLRLALAGDVMIGRGVDQVLPQSVPPSLHERHVRSARRYVELAEEASGPIPAPVGLEYPWGEALAEIERAAPDATVVNLETAATTSEDARAGKGIHYRTHPANVGCLAAAGVDVAAVANNHVLDWGPDGLRETLRALDAHGILSAGAGADARRASAPAAVGTGGAGGRVLVFGCASPTSGVPRDWGAKPGRGGVWLLPVPASGAAREVGRVIDESRRDDDVVVVSVHWGENWGYRVGQEQRSFARRLIEEAGADLVHGHSSHHPKGFELHRGRLILHGCGDLLNDYEGIAGHEEYRPELTLLYFPVLDAVTGRLRRMLMAPMRLRRFRLERAPPEDVRWLRDTLDRECRRLGDLGVETVGGGRLRVRT